MHGCYNYTIHCITQMICKYCSKQATGINYRPNPNMDSVPTCLTHATSLYIPFCSHNSQPHKNAFTALQEILNKLMDSIVAQFNLIKTEALYHEEQMRKIDQENALNYRMNCSLTSPYMIISADEELLLSALIKRIKFRYEKEKISRERDAFYQLKIQQNESEMRQSYSKTHNNKKYLFFTPQTSERSRVEGSSEIKKILQDKIGKVGKTVGQRQKKRSEEYR